jgi:hypothetical protein
LTAQRPPSPALSIGLSGATTASLTWSAVANAGQYRLFRDTAAYFSPDEPAYQVTDALDFSDAGAAGDPDVNHFYVVKAGCSSGFAGDPSNRVGEFDFALAAGDPAIAP